MKNIRLIIGTHNSQPVGASSADIEEAYQSSYKPFLTQLYNHQEVHVVLHYSGLLLSWFEEHHPELLMLLNDMVKRKQVEILGGGYYDPVLPLIPNSDRSGQIELLTTFLRRKFGKRPRGGWITERIWEPSLASTIKNSGMEYVFLDDHYFDAAGFSGSDMFRPCITEDQGKTLVVYPICSTLRGMVPKETPESVISYLLSLRGDEDENRIAVLLDDGEKYRQWEKGGKRFYKDGWLEQFIALLAKEKGKIDTTLPVFRPHDRIPSRKAYFRCTSLDEMMNWTADIGQQKTGERSKAKPVEKDRKGGGYFRQVLSRYPESNMLYAKVLYTHLLVNQIRGDRARKKSAREELWRGECNNAFWHSVRGGIYENRLRKATYASLIEAEKITREKGIFKPSMLAVDFDMDGEMEYLYQGQEFNGYIHRIGGALFELDHLKEAWNYLDTLSRYRESYHDEGWSAAAFDWYPRRAFVDHFFQSNENINSFDRMTYAELGNFIARPYRVVGFDRDRNELRFVSNGRITVKAKQHPLELRKRYVFRKSALTVAYTIFNTSEIPLHCNFGSEINLSLSENASDSIEITTVAKPGAERRSAVGLGKTIVESASEVAVSDLRRNVSLAFAANVPFKLWSLPVETSTWAGTKPEKTYQSTCIVPQWYLSLKPGETWSVEIVMSVGR